MRFHTLCSGCEIGGTRINSGLSREFYFLRADLGGRNNQAIRPCEVFSGPVKPPRRRANRLISPLISFGKSRSRAELSFWFCCRRLWVWSNVGSTASSPATHGMGRRCFRGCKRGGLWCRARSIRRRRAGEFCRSPPRDPAGDVPLAVDHPQVPAQKNLPVCHRHALPVAGRSSRCGGVVRRGFLFLAAFSGVVSVLAAIALGCSLLRDLSPQAGDYH